jgi:hypothetical protein
MPDEKQSKEEAPDQAEVDTQQQDAVGKTADEEPDITNEEEWREGPKPGIPG